MQGDESAFQAFAEMPFAAHPQPWKETCTATPSQIVKAARERPLRELKSLGNAID